MFDPRASRARPARRPGRAACRPLPGSAQVASRGASQQSSSVGSHPSAWPTGCRSRGTGEPSRSPSFGPQNGRPPAGATGLPVQPPELPAHEGLASCPASILNHFSVRLEIPSDSERTHPALAGSISSLPSRGKLDAVTLQTVIERVRQSKEVHSLAEWVWTPRHVGIFDLGCRCLTTST